MAVRTGVNRKGCQRAKQTSISELKCLQKQISSSPPISLRPSQQDTVRPDPRRHFQALTVDDAQSFWGWRARTCVRLEHGSGYPHFTPCQNQVGSCGRGARAPWVGSGLLRPSDVTGGRGQGLGFLLLGSPGWVRPRVSGRPWRFSRLQCLEDRADNVWDPRATF